MKSWRGWCLEIVLLSVQTVSKMLEDTELQQQLLETDLGDWAFLISSSLPGKVPASSNKPSSS